MRVCDVVLNSIWYDPRVIKQLREYEKNGISIYAVGLRDIKTNEEEISKLPGVVNIVPIERKYYRPNRTIFTKIAREFTIFRRVKSAIIQTKADIIHANDLNSLVPAFYAAKKLKCRLIYDTHEVFLENHNIANSRLKHIFWSYFEKKIINKIDLLVCVSNAAASHFKKKYNVKDTIVVTNCPEEMDSRKYLKKESRYFEVLNHGQYYAGRGYDIMINAAESDNNMKIHYVLRGFGELESKLRSIVNQKRLSNVIFEPPVKVYELIPYAARSHVGVAITEPTCLNFQLSISNKLFEYAAAGLPVIMSNIPEHNYLNDKYKFGIILKENTGKCLREAINKFFCDPVFYNACAQNALKMTRELTWHTEFKKLITCEIRMLQEK